LSVISLSPRERQVVELQSRGLRYREIAVALGITRETVKTYLVHARLKLDVADGDLVRDKKNGRPV
jgi:DNA-binding CsgD family transcriptional regulator